MNPGAEDLGAEMDAAAESDPAAELDQAIEQTEDLEADAKNKERKGAEDPDAEVPVNTGNPGRECDADNETVAGPVSSDSSTTSSRMTPLDQQQPGH